MIYFSIAVLITYFLLTKTKKENHKITSNDIEIQNELLENIKNLTHEKIIESELSVKLQQDKNL